MTQPIDRPSDRPIRRRGILFIISSPSGAGKTTLAKRLLESNVNISLSISVTTRPQRPNEIDGRDYHFVADEKFEAMVAANEFLEWAHVFGNRYGTPRAAVEDKIANGSDVLFDIDWQGAQRLRQEMSEDVVSLFILPPSACELEDRLHRRQTDSQAVIAGRMARAADEISHWDGYDYILVNDQIDECLAKTQAILIAERTKRTRQVGLSDFARTLITDLTNASPS